MEKVNLTAYDINCYQSGNLVESFSPSGQVARVDYRRESTEILGVRFTAISPMQVVVMSRADFLRKSREPAFTPDTQNFRSEELNTVFIVSKQIFDALPHRYDLICPDTDQPVLDAEGKLIGCNGYIYRGTLSL